MRLAEDFLGDQRLVVRDDAAGVHDFQRPAAPFRLAIDAVTGDARLVGDDGAARTRQTVEERGFAHVGATDDNERWKQFCHKFLSRTPNARSSVLSNLPM